MIDLTAGRRVTVRAPVTPRFTVTGPSTRRQVLVPVRGPSGSGSGASEVSAHVADATPHPVYDDLPDLSLLFDNALI